MDECNIVKRMKCIYLDIHMENVVRQRSRPLCFTMDTLVCIVCEFASYALSYIPIDHHKGPMMKHIEHFYGNDGVV